jgi:translation elongation factor EF-1alpha
MIKQYPELPPQWTNIAIIGPAQHGKSTLAGFLLYMLNEVSPEVLEVAEKAARERGDLSRKFAFILDRSREERGLSLRNPSLTKPMTLKPSWWGFEIHGKPFMLIDTPGQYIIHRLPQMIGGLSEADAVVLVVDIKDYIDQYLSGEQEWVESGQVIPGTIAQIRTLLAITKYFGVNLLIIALHKMDLVDFDQNKFNEVKVGLENILLETGWDNQSVQFIPTAIRPKEGRGYNISEINEIDWYEGRSFKEAIQQFLPSPILPEEKLRVHINRVYQSRKGGGGVRGFELVVTGKVLSGCVRVKDELCIMPSETKCRVRSVRSIDGFRDVKRQERWLPQSYANVGQIVGIGLSVIEYGQRQRLESGEVIGPINAPPSSSDQLIAEIIVLHRPFLTNLLLNRISGIFSMGFFSTGAQITEVSIDQGANWIRANKFISLLPTEITIPEEGNRFLVKILLGKKAPLDAHVINTKLGRFILLDPNQFLVCGGTIKDIL